jgi:hypothetical protein
MRRNRADRIAEIELQMEQLEKTKKQLIAQKHEADRKARTKRLIERGAILESLIDGADSLTNDQFKAFLQKTIQSDYARRALDTIKAQDGTTGAAKAPETAQTVD